MLLPSLPAQALFATEFTQLANNYQLGLELGEQVRTVEQLVKTYKNQVDQLREQVRAGLSIGGVSLTDVVQIKRDLDNYQAALQSLGRDLKGLGTAFDTRMAEAKMTNLSLADYMRLEQQRIDAGHRAAKVRVEREVQLMEQVRQDILLAKQYGDAVSATQGVHQAQGLMNAQANLMLQQLNKLVLLHAEAQGSDRAQEDSERAAEAAAASARMQSLRDAQGVVDARNQAAIKALRSLRTP